MSLSAQYSTTTPAFTLLTAPTLGEALPATDPNKYGNRPLAVLLQADAHNIRFTVDGSAPTSSYGMLLVAGADPFYYAGPLSQLRFIQTESGSILNVTYVGVNEAQGPSGPIGPTGVTGPSGATGPSGGGGGVAVGDGSTTVDPCTSILFNGATVTDAGGGQATVNFSGGGWVRPSGWLPLPAIGAGVQKVELLAAITNDAGNYFALKASGAYTVDWGDGTVSNVAAGVKAQHQYTYAAISSGTTVTYNGVTYRQAIVTLTPQAANNITDLNLNQKHSFFAAITNTPWLDVLVSSSAMTTFELGGTNTNFAMLEQFRMQENAVATLTADTFCQSTNQLPVIKNIAFADMPALITVVNGGGQGFVYFTLSSPNVTFGNVDALVDATTFIQTTQGGLGNVTVGTLNSATNTNSMVTADGNVGNVRIGAMPLVVNIKPTVFSESGSIGNVTVGAMALASNSSGMYQAFVLAECSVADVSFGATPLLTGIHGWAFVTGNNGDVGNVTFADLSAFVAVNSATGFLVSATGCVASITVAATPALTNIDGGFNYLAGLRRLAFSDLSALTSATGAFTGGLTSAIQSLIMNGAVCDIDISDQSMSAAALAALFTSLGTVVAKTITVTGNYGSPSLTPTQLLIATAKGWTVVQ